MACGHQAWCLGPAVIASMKPVRCLRNLDGGGQPNTTIQFRGRVQEPSTMMYDVRGDVNGADES